MISKYLVVAALFIPVAAFADQAKTDEIAKLAKEQTALVKKHASTEAVRKVVDKILGVLGSMDDCDAMDSHIKLTDYQRESSPEQRARDIRDAKICHIEKDFALNSTFDALLVSGGYYAKHGEKKAALEDYRAVIETCSLDPSKSPYVKKAEFGIEDLKSVKGKKKKKVE